MIINYIILFIFILSVIYTFKYKFIQLKFVKESKKELKNKNSYIAFLLSLGSHIGAGNILGVTTALLLGGPGVLFWMVICTIFTTIFSLIENTLGLKYRVTIDNEFRGGSPYYIEQGFKKKKLAVIFSFFLVISSTIFFLPIQVRGVSYSLYYGFNINKYLVFILLILFCLLVIFRGTKILSKFISKFVPIMTAIFLVCSFIALVKKGDQIFNVICVIIKDAFTFKSGIFSLVIIGLKRSLFSNEAGLGTAPSLNCYSDSNRPIGQGYVQVLTCFIDTVVMCVLLGFIILLYDVDLTRVTGEELAIKVFGNIFGKFGNILGTFFLFTFSLATIVSGYYSGETNILFNSLKNKKNINLYKFIYQVLFIIGIYIGVFFENNKLWDLVDLGLVILGLINIFVILRLQKDFKKELEK